MRAANKIARVANEIAGIKVIPLKQIGDERGKILHMLRADDAHFQKFGEIYFSVCNPGFTKGWIEHRLQTQHYAVISGMLTLVLYDNRPTSPSFGSLMEVCLGEENYQLVIVPPGIVSGFRAKGHQPAILANCATHPHAKEEVIHYALDGSEVPYQWSKP